MVDLSVRDGDLNPQSTYFHFKHPTNCEQWVIHVHLDYSYRRHCRTYNLWHDECSRDCRFPEYPNCTSIFYYLPTYFCFILMSRTLDIRLATVASHAYAVLAAVLPIFTRQFLQLLSFPHSHRLVSSSIRTYKEF